MSLAKRAATASKRGYKKRRFQKNDLVSQVVRQVMPKIQRPSSKYVGYAVNDSNMAPGGTAYKISNPSLGTQDTNRIGDGLSLLSLEFHLCAKALPSLTGVAKCRVVLFQWMDADSPNPQLSDVIFDTTYPWNSAFHFDPVKSGQFRILRDWRFNLDNTGNPSFIDKCYIKGSQLPSDKLQFLGGATMGKGHIYVLYLSDQLQGAGGVMPQLDFRSRLRFVDS